MPYGLYISAEGAHAQSTRLETIANNLANVDTVGFKRELAVCQARYAEAIQEGNVEAGSGAVEDLGGGIFVRQTLTDFSSGPLKRTQIPTDVAIEGEGFFLVRKGEDTLLTRAGDFRTTSRGELVTQQGYAVLSDTGTPIIAAPENGPWEISSAGTLHQRDGTSQNLAIVKPAAYGDLVKAGENAFRSPVDPQPVPPGERRVAPGFIELSAVRPTAEMTEMIEAARVLEANVNMMKAQDQMLSGLVNRLLRV
jgi:flagellar basal-body rod protein FlgF/flagellar basal-body rod protein FlgG